MAKLIVKLTKKQKLMITNIYCPKSRDRTHKMETIQGDDVGKDEQCVKCGYYHYEAYY